MDVYEYSHGGNAVFERGGEGVIDLSASINPLGMPAGVTEAIIRAIPGCTGYPDSFSAVLREKIAEFESVEPDSIFCGGGASDVIFRLPGAARAQRVMVTAPTFSDYERAAVASGCEIVRFALSPENGFRPDRCFVETVARARPDLVFVCNPNNPTGVLTDARLIGELLDCCRKAGAVVVVDECFLDFAERAGEYTSKVFLGQYPNLVILKAFTKLFALPGIRLGYAISPDKALIDSLYSRGADWSVSCLAQAAGVAALADAVSFVEQTRAFVSGARADVESGLARLGYEVFQSAVNYVFLRNPYPFDLRDELDRRGIRIRSCGDFHGLDGSYCRIAVSTKENNAKLLAAVSEITIKNLGNCESQNTIC